MKSRFAALLSFLFLLSQAIHAAETPGIYGIHDHTPDPTEYLNHIKPVSGGGWVTATVSVNNNPADRKSSYFRVNYAVDNSASNRFVSLTNLAVLQNGTNADIAATNIGSLFVPKATQTFDYDADGNLTRDLRWTNTWDAENRLVDMEAVSSVEPNARKHLTFGYDWMGRRITKTVSNWTGSAWVKEADVRFLYDGWNLIAELNATNNSVICSYMWGLDLSGTMQGAGGVGGLLSVTESGNGSHFAAFDGNGNLVGLVAATGGTNSAIYEYGPFGEAIRATGVAAAPNPFRFSTKYVDVESDLICYSRRNYNPGAGRWISRDPIEEDGGININSLAFNDLINDCDPLGLAMYGFDGTWNDRKKRKTNVAIMLDLYAGANTDYEIGIGTTFWTKFVGGVTGAGGRNRINSAYKALVNFFCAGDKEIVIIGFSRGSAEAREFANKINREGVGPSHVKASIKFLGLFDSVGSFGVPGNSVNVGYDLSIPNIVEQTSHATANDERRRGFPLSSILDPNNPNNPRLVEKGFPGAHSDVGGGYNSGDLSDAPLQWMWSQAVGAGVPMKPIPTEYVEISNPIVHNEAWRITRFLFKNRTVYYPNVHSPAQ